MSSCGALPTVHSQAGLDGPNRFVAYETRQHALAVTAPDGSLPIRDASKVDRPLCLAACYL